MGAVPLSVSLGSMVDIIMDSMTSIPNIPWETHKYPMEEAYDDMDPPCQAFLPPAADVDEVLWSDQDQKRDAVMDLLHWSV